MLKWMETLPLLSLPLLHAASDVHSVFSRSEDLMLTRSLSKLCNIFIMGILTSCALGLIIKIVALVSSEEMLVQNDSITIDNYYQQNDCSDVQFLLSNGRTRVHITNEYNSGQTLKLFFPKHLSIFDYQWLEVWCAGNNTLLSSVLLDPEHFYLQLDPFKRLVSYVKSGPILVIDEKTFYVTNFHFEKEMKNVSFWVGTSRHGNGFIRMNQMEYKGEDVVVTLPAGVTMYDVEYFGVRSSTNNLTYTKVPKLRSKLPQLGENHKKKTFISKCCPKGQKKMGKECVPISLTDCPDSIKVYDGEDLIENITLSYYTYSPNCREMYILERDEAFLQLSGLLHIHGGEYVDVISKDTFCIDYSESEDGCEEVVYTCFEDKTIVALADKLIKFCIFCSVFCLFITFFIYSFLKAARKSRGAVIVGFSGSMLLRFLLLFLLKVFPDYLCYELNPFYIIVYNSTFVWLLFLVYESYYRVSNYKHRFNHKRCLVYLIFSLVTPAIISIMNKTSDGVYILKAIDTSDGNCDIKNNNILLINLLFVVMLLIITFALTVVTWNKINEIKDDRWKVRNQFAKKVLISSILMMVILYSSWAAEILDSVTSETNKLALVLLDAFQGVFVFITFVLHNPTYDTLPRLDHYKRWF